MDLTTHPSLLLAALFLPALGAMRLRRGGSWPLSAAASTLTATAALVVVGLYVAMAAWYWWQPAFFDQAEPTIPSVAAVFGAGMPLYPALEAPERYAHIYGPALFLIHAAALAAFGAAISSSKAVGVVAILASLLGGHALYRRRSGTRSALVATAVCALTYSAFGNASYWTRSDPLLILSVVAALAAVRLPGRVPAVVVLGLAAGTAVNLKFTGPVYLLPVFAMALAERGVATVVGAVLLAALIAGAPFLLPNVSLAHYWDYVELSARNGLEASRLRQNLEWTVCLAAPVAAVSLRGWRSAGLDRTARVTLISLAIAMCLVAFAAAKPGGGPLHLLPFVPILAYSFLSLSRAPSSDAMVALVTACALAALVIAIPGQLLVIRTVSGRNLTAALAAIDQFAEGHPGRRVAVGYAGTSYLSHARPAIVFRVGDYLIDAPAVQEHRLSGHFLPEATIRAIEDCRVEYWLLPRGEAPFVVPSAYAPAGPPRVFPDRFVEVFLSRHVLVGRAGPFDVWECRSRNGVGASTASADAAAPPPDLWHLAR